MKSVHAAGKVNMKATMFMKRGVPTNLLFRSTPGSVTVNVQFIIPTAVVTIRSEKNRITMIVFELVQGNHIANRCENTALPQRTRSPGFTYIHLMIAGMHACIHHSFPECKLS